MPKDKVHKIHNCRLCNSNQLKKVITLTQNPIGDRFYQDRQKAKECELHNVEVMLCLECGQMQLSEVVEPSEIYQDADIGYLYSTSTSVGLLEHFTESAKRLVERFCIPEGSLVVEIGSNEGIMLEAFKNLGMRVLGVDPAKVWVEKANSRGITSICDFFTPQLAEKIISQYGKAKVVVANNVVANNVVANNVVANIPGFTEVIMGIGALLDSDGVFVFETGYGQSVVKKHLIDTIYHEHISYFSAKPLERFFHQCGLELFDAEEIWTKGGSLRGYVSKPQQFSKTKQLQELISKEDSLIFASHVVANSYDLERLFSEIERLMGDDGEFVFESFYAKAVLERNLLDMVYCEHLNYLYLLPLKKFLETKSLFIRDAKLVDSKGGSIQITITRDQNSPMTDRLKGLLQEEEAFFSQGALVFDNFARNLEEFRAKVEALAREIKAKQGKVVVYGASVGGVMMVYHLGLAPYIDCFIDDNPAKIGTYAPALAVPVLNSNVLESDTSIKQVISVAWRFMSSITKKHEAFLLRGGEFYSLSLANLEIIKITEFKE